MDDPPRPGLPPRPDPQVPPPHREPRRPARPDRPVEAPGGPLARGRVHRREPAVPGRQAASARPRRRLRRSALFDVFDDRLPRESDLSLLLAREGARADRAGRTRARRPARDPGHPRRREPTSPRADQASPATSSSPGPTSPGSSSGAAVHISFVGQDDGSETERELDGQPVSIDQRQPDDRPRPDQGAADSRRTRASPSCGRSRAGRSTSHATDGHAMLAQPNPDGRSNAMSSGRGSTASTSPADRATCGSSTSASTCPSARPRCTRRRSSTSVEHVKPDRARQLDARVSSNVVAARRAAPGHASGARRPARDTSRRRDLRSTGCSSGCRPTTLADHAARRRSPATTTTRSASCIRAPTSCGRSRTGTQLRRRSGLRYTPTTTFETFPFPHPTDEQRERVGEAARRLVELRDGWLNPPGLDPADLEKRTLTNLYNQRPTWLDHAHAALDAAVFAAYGWPADLADAEILETPPRAQPRARRGR